MSPVFAYNVMAPMNRVRGVMRSLRHSREGVRTFASFRRFADSAAGAVGSNVSAFLYLSAPLDRRKPDQQWTPLAADIQPRDHLLLPCLAEELDCRPPTMNLWVASPNTTAHTHFDASHNFFVQVRAPSPSPSLSP